MNKLEVQSATRAILISLVESIEEHRYPLENLQDESQLIVCECGAKILIVPDLVEMVRSIKAHAEKHAKRETSKWKAKAELDRIEKLLSDDVLSEIAASEPSGNHRHRP